MISKDFKPKISFKNYCEFCNYGTDKKSNFVNHKNSMKHKKSIISNQNKLFVSSTHNCENCNKKYKDYSGLWRHKKKCKLEEKINKNLDIETINDKQLIMLLLKETSDFKNMMMEVIKNGTHNNITHTNSHNKSFNLQFFLNETCKNALNITEFIDSLQLQLSDLEKVGELGYVEGISNIIIKNLNALDVTERPVHCTDKKRETMYIKDEDKWEKEDENKDKLHKMVKKVSNKNIQLITEFREKYPEYKKCTSKNSDKFNKIIIESIGGNGDNEYEKEEKIIKKIAKEVFVDK
jgi:hypothetical protein